MKTKLAAALRVGRIRYLNTLPFYHGLALTFLGDERNSTWQAGSPVEINGMMQRKEIDIAPISSLEYLNHQDQYLLFPDLCIGARDFSASVLLLSRERLEGLNGAAIALSEESLSAATLLKILLKFKYKFQNHFYTEPANPEGMLAKTDACLVIGDEALFFRPKEFVYKTDLSQLWWEWTKLPFCFSVWAVQRRYYEKYTDAVHEFFQGLKACLERNLSDIEGLLREGAEITLASENFPTAFGYLFNLNYNLDESMQESLALFFRFAHRLGVSPKPRKLRFIET